MKNSTLKELTDAAIAEKDINILSDLYDEIVKKRVKKSKAEVIDFLMDYAKSGSVEHWKRWAMMDLKRLVDEGETKYGAFFQWALGDPEFVYWAVTGLTKTMGKEAYESVIAVAKDVNLKLEHRANAVKCLAKTSGQLFDRGLNKDPGHWKADQLRMDEVIAWEKNGYPQGPGYPEPNVHPSLKNPQSEPEKVVAELDKKLAKDRDHNDFCNPVNWLVVANIDSIERINQKWILPPLYLRFLTSYSPQNVTIYSRKYVNYLELFGADELITNQNGYSFNPVTNEIIKDWPQNMVVIASDGGDPYCIDLSKIEGDDAPVYKSLHGMGEWKFRKYASGFIEFLKKIT